MSIQKPKLIMVGVKSEDEQESMPIIIKGEAIQVVNDFMQMLAIWLYCQSQGEVNRDVEKRISRAFKAFGILQCSIFMVETCPLRQRD